MNEFKSKIVNKLLFNNLSIGMAFLGASGLIVSWALGLSLLTFISIVSVAGSIGWSLTNLVMNYESMGMKLFEESEREKNELMEEKLDDLYEKLKRDRDPRDQSYLRDLRLAYKTLKDDFKDGKLTYVAASTFKKYDDLFNACIESLEYQFELYLRGTKSRGKIKARILEDREKELQEIGRNVEWFVDSVANLGQKNDDKELDKLREELDQNLEIAKKVKEELSDNLDERYKEFLN